LFDRRCRILMSEIDGQKALEIAEALQSTDPHGALTAARQAMAQMPNSPQPLVILGNALRSLGKLDESAGAYEQALRLDPQNLDASCGLGNVRRDQGRLTEAVAAYRDATAIAPTYPLAHHNLGRLL